MAILAGTQTKAQQITGLWFSGDSSRVYEIKAAAGNTFEAIVKSTSRKTDSAGFIAIRNLHYNARKKRYEGIIYTLSGNQPCFVKVTARNNQLVLKLSRMFLFDAVLTWNRAAASMITPGG